MFDKKLKNKVKKIEKKVRHIDNDLNGNEFWEFVGFKERTNNKIKKLQSKIDKLILNDFSIEKEGNKIQIEIKLPNDEQRELLSENALEEYILSKIKENLEG